MLFLRAYQGLWLALAVTVPATAAPLDVAVTNVTSARGRIHVDICLKAQFTTTDCSYSAEAPAQIGTTVVTLPDVPPGRYAAQAFHDRNSNGKVDRGLFGIPTEPVGFSNDAPVHLKPPSYDDAAFDQGAKPGRISFRLRHFP